MVNEMLRSHPLLQLAFQLTREIEGSFLQLAKTLHEIREGRVWEFSGYESFDDPTKYNLVEELGISRGTASKLINIYEKYILVGKCDPGLLIEAGWSKLSEGLSHMKTKEDAEKVLDLAVHSRNREDLRATLREQATGINQMSCPHPHTYTLEVCRVCRSTWKTGEKFPHIVAGVEHHAIET